MVSAGHVYPSDEEEHTSTATSTSSQLESVGQALPHQPLQNGGTMTTHTPDRQTASRVSVRSLPRDTVSDERRRVFRRRNDHTFGSLTAEHPVENPSAPRCPPTAAPLTPQPLRTSSEGAAADPGATSSRLPVIRSAPRPLRARARTYSNGMSEGREDEEEWEARRALAAGGQCRAASAPDWDGLFRTPPRRMRSRTLDTPVCSGRAGDADTGPGLDVEQGTPVRRTVSCDDEVLQQATPPQLRRMAHRPVTQEVSSRPHLPSLRGWNFSYGRKARALICVGLYLVLMTLSPLITNTERDQTGLMSSSMQPHHQHESEFGKEIHFNGMGMAIDNDRLIEVNDAVTSDVETKTGVGSDPVIGKAPAKAKSIAGEKTPAKVQRARGKKKRRPVIAQARSLGFEDRPVFIPKVEPQLQTNGLSSGGDGHTHTKGVHEIRTFSLSDEDLKAPLPEELLPPEYESGPSATLKILTLSAWICMTILVLETGFGEIRRRFQYVNLRQLRSHREDRSM